MHLRIFQVRVRLPPPPSRKEIECIPSVIGVQADVYVRLPCTGVDHRHEIDLMAPFLNTVLIDTDGVDPQGFGIVWASCLPQGLLKIGCDRHTSVTDQCNSTSG